MFILFNPIEWTDAKTAVYTSLNDWNGTAVGYKYRHFLNWNFT